MTQIVAGWYPDPAPGQPGAPPLVRYWDGVQWTAHVQPAPSQAPPYAPGAPAPVHSSRQEVSTPDGERLAGWWARLGAYLLDAVVLLTISAALGWPFVRRLGAAYSDFFDATMRAAQNGTPPPDQAALMGDVVGPLLGFLAISLVVNFVYNVSFLKAVQATPGKLLLGLRVRLRERPGSLAWGTVLVRWGVQNVASLIALVPVVGTVAGLYPFVDGLWPLWDSKRQALHDKAARTNVVRRR